MTALAMQQDFAIIPATEWLVLLCDSNRTLALAAALASFGAWTPTWKRKRRLPRSPMSRITTEACIPGMVFVPACEHDFLPRIPKCRQRFMYNADWTLTRISDRELDPLRSIADKPLPRISELPKAGSIVRLPASTGAWQGLRAKVLASTQRKATVAIETQPGIFSREIQLPPCLLLKI